LKISSVLVSVTNDAPKGSYMVWCEMFENGIRTFRVDLDI